MGAHRPAINDAQGAGCARSQTRRHHVRHAETRRRVRAGVAPPPEIGGRDELPRGSMTRGREQRTAPILSHGQTTSGQCGFNQAASHPADPIKRHRARRERSHPKAMLTTQTSAVALDLLENSIVSSHLKPKSPELNPVENIWQFMRDNW